MSPRVILMLKKTLALMLLSVYMLFSVGILKATHFCMGREASVQFFSANAKKCPCSIYAKEKTSCCDDEHELIKIEDEQKVITAVSMPMPAWKLERIFTERFLADELMPNNVRERELPDKAPPAIPLWKANSTYVFYDDESDSEAKA